MTQAYPLHWPPGRPRTESHRRQESAFGGTTVRRETQFVLDEIRRFGGRYVVISTNIELRQDGLPYSNRRSPDDEGVAVYFDMDDRQLCFACDRWRRVEDNIRAIGKTIEAIRGIARWGSGDMVNAAFQGFEALPPPGASKPWRGVLGLGDGPATFEDARKKYLRLAQERHPDRGGSDAAMRELNQAFDAAKKELGKGLAA